MGYHVSILRTAGGRPQPILRDELTQLAAARGDLRLEPEGPRELIHVSRPHGTETLAFQNGEIWTKNPERPTVELMLELAVALGARVRGDEHETYRTPDEWYTHPDDVAEIEEAKRASLRMRRRVKLVSYAWLAGFMLFAGSCGLAIEYCSGGKAF